ncbi:MAG: PEP/pyruvate-binding domain-containing protein, partial [Burkholderiaceae bacterium]
MQRGKYVIPFSQLRMSDVDSVGGKNASLGEMLSQLSAAGVRVPDGFATTAEAFREFLRHARLSERIADRLAQLNVADVRALSAAGEEIRSWIVAAPFSEEFKDEIESIFQELISDSASEVSFAVRSSATAEDLPDASFAGQQETFLNVSGIEAVLDRIKHVFASLYNDRAIAYRVHKGFVHADVALSAGVQQMVRSDLG